MELREYHKKILAVLDEDGGYITGDLAEKVTPKFGNNRQHAGAICSWLIELERAGYVRRLDDRKPVCWVKTHNV